MQESIRTLFNMLRCNRFRRRLVEPLLGIHTIQVLFLFALRQLSWHQRLIQLVDGFLQRDRRIEGAPWDLAP